MKKIIRIVLLLIVLGAIATWLLRSNWLKKETSNVIRLSGNVEMTQVDIAFKAPGRLVELNVKEGSTVTKDAVIARIDRLTMESQKTRELAGVDSATAQLAQMITAVEFQRQSIDGDLALRQAELRTAEARLAELLAGSRTQEIAAAKAQLADMKTWHEQAKRDWERAQTLFKNEDISAAQYEQFRSKYESTAQSARQAEEREGRVVGRGTPADLFRARADAAVARVAAEHREPAVRPARTARRPFGRSPIRHTGTRRLGERSHGATRSGRNAAIRIPMKPPIERPQKCAGPTASPRLSFARAVTSARPLAKSIRSAVTPTSSLSKRRMPTRRVHAAVGRQRCA